MIDESSSLVRVGGGGGGELHDDAFNFYFKLQLKEQKYPVFWLLMVIQTGSSQCCTLEVAGFSKHQVRLRLRQIVCSIYSTEANINKEKDVHAITMPSFKYMPQLSMLAFQGQS